MENIKLSLPSPNVSLTPGENDKQSDDSDVMLNISDLKQQENVIDAGNVVAKDTKAPWVNLFKHNRKMEDNIKLKFVVNQSYEVILDVSDEGNIEDKWGYGLVGYFAGRFLEKVALLQLCDS